MFFKFSKSFLVAGLFSSFVCLPVELPEGNDWVEDTVKITYMSCSDTGCKPPVIGKLVQVRVPGASLLLDQ